VTVAAAPALAFVVAEMCCGLHIVRLAYKQSVNLRPLNTEQRLHKVRSGLESCRCAPFWFEFLENFPLCVVTDNLDVYETTQIEPLGSELGHITNATRALIVEKAVAVQANVCPKLPLTFGAAEENPWHSSITVAQAWL
jgi:hypothetical protein